MHWPANIYALADHLGISRFAVIGGFGGGHYALACAYALPKDMLSAVGIVAGPPAWIAGTKDILLIMRILAQFARTWPSGLRAILSYSINFVIRNFDDPGCEREIERWFGTKVIADEKDIPIEERRMRVQRFLVEGFAQGFDALVQEIQLLTGDWGFKFEDIKYDPIQVWHGTPDVISPISNIRYMVDHLPHAVLKEYDETDLAIGNDSYMEEILLKLMPLETKFYHKDS